MVRPFRPGTEDRNQAEQGLSGKRHKRDMKDLEHQDNRERRWFAVRSKPRQEHVARLNYEQQGYHVYLPVVQTVRRHARKVEQVMRPLFPGYLFLHLAPEERAWTAIGSTKGAIGPVRFGDCFPQVPDWIISGIKNRECDQGFIPLRALSEKILKSGNRVVVAIGNQEMEGIFLNFRDKERVVILLDMLKRQMQVVAPLTSLKVAV